MPQISGVIITYNEEKNIARCIDSLLPVVDEIIVVDSYSTDKTKEICISKGVTFIEHPFDGHIEQKNYATSQATYDYVLSLDADEALDETLRQAILDEKGSLSDDAYIFNRMTNYCGQWIKHGAWYPDRKLRLWHKAKGKWGGTNPHDKVIMQDGTTTTKLKGEILHYSYYTISEHIDQIQKFSTIAAKAKYDQGKTTSIAAIVLKPLFRFVRDYILKRGFLDGYYGFIVCWNASYEVFLKYVKLRELRN